MPHFIIDCSRNVLKNTTEMEVITQVHEVAVDSGLFQTADIKVRMRPFDTYLVGGKPGQPFVHVFGDIMQGRTTEQKADLSRRMVSLLKKLFPNVPFIAMNVRDFDKTTYSNLNSL